jgi:hypothetical protein
MMRSSKSNELADIEVKMVAETPQAWLVRWGDGIQSSAFGGKAPKEQAWVPKSQCELFNQRGGVSTLTLPQWLAEEKGMV